MGIYTGIAAFGPLTYIVAYYKNLARDLLKFRIAEQKDWYYDGVKDTSAYYSLLGKYPELFRKGNKRQYVEDQFWGKVPSSQGDVDFYSGLFHYTIETGYGRRRSSTTYHTHFVALPLGKNLQAKFHLYPEGFGSKLINLFSKKEINTESEVFNKTFAFSYNGEKSQKALSIVQSLSPAVQTKLLDLVKKKGKFDVLFSQNTVIFLFKGYLLSKMKTDFSKSTSLAREDEEYLQRQLDTLLDISSEMTHYLD